MKNSLLFSILALLALASTAALAQNDSAASSDSPEKALLQRSIDYVSTLPAFGAEITMTFEVADKAGATRDGKLTGSLAMAGTDRVRFRVMTEDGAMDLYFSPDSKLIYLEEQKKYLDGAAFVDRQKSFTLIPSREFRPAQIMLSDFVHGDASLLESIESFSTVVPADDAEGTLDHIRAEGGGLTTDFWIRKGEQPVLERLQLDLSQMAMEANPDLAKALVTYTFSNWNTTPEFAPDYFTFVMPEGATRLDTSGNGGAANAMKDNPAPPISLPMLDSDAKLDLAAHKGKDVVILDFWASWCGPCRIGLPVVAELAKAYKDKNVVFYAVNVGESPEQAKAFLTQTGLDLPVAMDTERDAQRKYQANSIPKTVIIDKEGIVREVHEGFSGALKDELTKTLDTLTK